MWDLIQSDIVMSVSIAVGLVVGIVVMAVLLKRSPKVIPGVAKPDRFGTAFVAGGAVVVGITALGSAISTTVAALTPGAVTVHDLGRMTAHVEPDLMALPHVEQASSTVVNVTITDAPSSMTTFLLIADLLPILLILIVCAAAVWLAIGLLHGRPFARRFPVALIVVSTAVMFCGIFAQFFAGIGRGEAARFLNAGSAAGQEPFIFLSYTLDLSPLGWGLLIGLLGGAFQLGSRMQQDTKGLV